MDLIDRKALIEELYKAVKIRGEVEVFDLIKNQPTIDAVPVVHGYNNNQNFSEVDEFRCSECGLYLEGWERHIYDEDLEAEFIKEYEFKYCPNCGADMRKGGKE